MLHRLDWLHQLEIDYDMSTFDTDPFEPQPEGRHTIFPFLMQAPGRNGDSAKAYVELPYTLPQDSTLFLLLQEKTPEIWMRKLDWVASHGGMVLINTHPDYTAFDSRGRDSFDYPVAFYKELLAYLQHRYTGQYWAALPKDVANYLLQKQDKNSLAIPSDPGHGRNGNDARPGRGFDEIRSRWFGTVNAGHDKQQRTPDSTFEWLSRLMGQTCCSTSFFPLSG
jgi:hypothetical protein